MTAASKGQAPATPDREQSHGVFPRAFIDLALETAAQARSRILIINGAARNDGVNVDEIAKSRRLSLWAQEVLEEDGFGVDLLDLSLRTARYEGEAGNWIEQIDEKWNAAHGIIIVTPAHCCQAPPVLKLIIDQAGRDCPKQLPDRAYGLVVHGDVAGIEATRRGLSDCLDGIGLVDSASFARLDRYLGYYENYADSHAAQDRDTGFQEDVRNVARALAKAVEELRAGRLSNPDRDLSRPRPT
jgi:NAD(P)H-dependent FMN reductase